MGLEGKTEHTLTADTRWFHICRAIIDSGDLARMGACTFSVYAVIKAYTDLNTGVAFPGVELIAEKCGISRVQVWRSVKTLIEMGYVSKGKEGRHNTYRLQERIMITAGNGIPSVEATWQYRPLSFANDIRLALARDTSYSKKEGEQLLAEYNRLSANSLGSFDDGVREIGAATGKRSLPRIAAEAVLVHTIPSPLNQTMPYRDFLRTPYWATVRRLMLKRQPECQVCKRSLELQVHHKTYAHRGDELRHLEDLIVLCGICHEKLHT